jgi:hypothetical protein
MGIEVVAPPPVVRFRIRTLATLARVPGGSDTKATGTALPALASAPAGESASDTINAGIVFSG